MRRFVFGFAIAVAALAPSMGRADDRQIAEFVKGRLQAEQQAGNLKGFNVDMTVEQGTIWLKGFVSTAEQEMLVLRAAQEAGQFGATQVVDEIEVKTANMTVPSAPAPMVVPVRTPNMYASMPQDGSAGQNQGAPAVPAMQASHPLPAGYAPGYQAGAPMPLPMAYNSTGAAGMGGSPNMPGYAWPGYAAHPNYAAVTYPKQYSASAWPYIGPFYPYPQVPLGWRRVELQWDDGWWFLDFHDR